MNMIKPEFRPAASGGAGPIYAFPSSSAEADYAVTSPPSLKLPPTLKLRRDKMADKRRERRSGLWCSMHSHGGAWERELYTKTRQRVMKKSRRERI